MAGTAELGRGLDTLPLAIFVASAKTAANASATLRTFGPSFNTTQFIVPYNGIIDAAFITSGDADGGITQGSVDVQVAIGTGAFQSIKTLTAADVQSGLNRALVRDIGIAVPSITDNTDLGAHRVSVKVVCSADLLPAAGLQIGVYLFMRPRPSPQA